jgi:hypothetical protein
MEGGVMGIRTSGVDVEDDGSMKNQEWKEDT